MALPDRAAQVLDLMVERGLGVGERPLFFICHSLGGLVVKQILRTSADDLNGRLEPVFGNTRAVLFLATPHAGADLPSLATAFRAVFGATVTLQDLRAHDAHLRDLFNWYRNHSAEAGVETACYFEQRSVRGLTIVNATSAHPGVGRDPVGLDEDHLSIAKPESRKSQVYLAATSLLRDYVLAPRPAAAPKQAAAAGSEPLDRSRVVHELPARAEKFFGREAELQELAQRLRDRKNTAVVGAAGLGKTALAAEALLAVTGDSPPSLANSPFPDGVVFLDLYALGGAAEPAWDTLANKLAGVAFMERSPSRERAMMACHARRILVVIEGGEEADGQDGRARIGDVLSVLSPQNRWLLLTRVTTQAAAGESVKLKEALSFEEGSSLFDSLTRGRISAGVRTQALELLAGHPLALTWAGNLLARDDDDPQRLLDDWKAEQLPALSEPSRAEHTLEWLFERSVRGLDDTARGALHAAGLLARAPFPTDAIEAALSSSGAAGPEVVRQAIKGLAHRSLIMRAGEPGHWQFTHVLGYRFARKEAGSDPAIRAGLGYWLYERISAELASGSPEAIANAIEHLGALLRADSDQRLWDPLVNAALYEFADRLSDLGRLVQVKVLLSAVAGWQERFPEDKAREPEWLREQSVLGIRQGDVMKAQGDLAGALSAYQESLKVGRRLAEADPSNTDWQRDLSLSFNKLGDVLMDQGDLEAALAAYRDSRHIRHRLADADASNAGWQRDLGVSQGRIGHVLEEKGDLGGALAAYRESLQVSSRLADSDPLNAVWQRDLSVSQEEIGDVLMDQGDLGGALAAYRESLQMSRRLAEADPSNAGWQRDLLVSHGKIGDVLMDQGDLGGALAAYRESLQLSRRLAEADPSNAGWQRDLNASHLKIGDVLMAQGDLGGALAAYRESLLVSRRLVEADPSNAGCQRDLRVSHEKIGDVLMDQGDLGGALAAYRESLRMSRRLAEADPSNAVWKRDLSVCQQKIGDVLRDGGDLGGALAAYRESLQVRRRLAEADVSNARWQSDLSFLLTCLAELHEQTGERDEALRLAQESLAIDERLAALDGSNATWQKDVVISRALVARLAG
jgi:tetratricopeptide (TPR) repeat protein